MITISNMDDVIDSRDVIERLEELESELEDFLEENESNTEKDFPDVEELISLRKLANEAEQHSSDWEHGKILIRYSYWQEYVQEMLEDCGDIPETLPWYVSINWLETAENIAQDYTTVSFDGVDYYVRCT